MAEVRRRTAIPVPVEALFDWHARPGAFERLQPPWERVRVLSREGEGLEVGSRLELEVRIGGVGVRWTVVHTACERPSGFVDEQERGPFATWRHAHRFLPDPDGCVLEDEITFAPPLGALGRALSESLLRERLERMLRFRHRRTHDDLVRHAAFADRPRLRVLISGAAGLVGRALAAFLTTGGHTVVPLVRSREREGVYWNVGAGEIDREALEGVDAVVHLAGEPIAGRRWTEAHKQRVRDSRVDGTRLLAEALAGLDRPPRVMVSGSAAGFYGDGGDAPITEESPSGEGFLAETARAWEAAARPAADAGIRLVTLRTGIVLSAEGGALEAMLPPFRAGAGGPLGGGRQVLPWIHLDDLVGLIHHALHDEQVRGPVNGTAPEPVPQRDFARALGRALGRPAVLPTPAVALELAMGRQMARELLLFGQRAVPARMQAAGFRFLHPEVDEALAFELGVDER